MKSNVSNSTSNKTPRAAGKVKDSNPKGLLSKKTFSNLIVANVIDWASKVKSSKKKDTANFEWSSEQREYLQNILQESPGFLKSTPLKDSKLKNYFLSIIENGIRREDIDTFYKYREQFPLNLLGLEINLSNFESNNQNQLTSKNKVDSGFYMLEAQIHEKPTSKIEYLVVKSTDPKHSFEVRTEKQKIFKRLIYLTQDTELALQGKPSLPTNGLIQFKLVPLTRHFFLSRLLKKISVSAASKRIAQIDDKELMDLWHQYDAIFKEHKPSNAYKEFLKKVEPTIIPSKEQQLTNLNLWRIKVK